MGRGDLYIIGIVQRLLEAGDAEMQEAASRTFVLVADPATAVDRLRHSGSPAVRRAAAAAMAQAAKMGNADAVAVLEFFAQDPDVEVRRISSEVAAARQA